MIVDKHKLIFIHIPKCAGTSMNNAFMDMTGHHNDWRWYYTHHRKKWDSYKKIAFVRNTWSWIESLYDYWYNLEKAEWYKPLDNQPTIKRQMQSGFRNATSSLADLISKIPDIACKQWAGQHFRPQSHFICDDFGRIMVDDVIHVEELTTEWPKLLASLDIPYFDLPHSNSILTDNPSSLTPQLADEVERLYANDIKRFGYKRPSHTKHKIQ